MRNSRYNYRRPVNEGDEEVPGEADGKMLTNKVRELRTSVSREKRDYPSSAGIRKSWKPLPATKNSYSNDLEGIQKPEPNTATKAHQPTHTSPSRKPRNIFIDDPVKSHAQPSSTSSNPAQLNAQISSTTPQPLKTQPPLPQDPDPVKPQNSLKSQRDAHKLRQKQSQERKSPREQYKASTTPERIKDKEGNPYKRTDAAKAKDYYNSIERKRKLENRRHRNSGHKSDSKTSEMHNSEEKDKSNFRAVSDPNLQNVNIDLFKRQLGNFEDKKQQRVPKESELKRVKVPVFEEDFEEITQTIENGVVVEEHRRTIKSPAIRGQNQPLEGFDVTEDFDTKDMEEDKGMGSEVQSKYLKTRNKKALFQDQANPSGPRSAREINTSQRMKSRPVDPSKHTSQGLESDYLLEESQEVVMFQSDSKNTSINLSSMHQRMGSSSSKDHLELTKGQGREETKEGNDAKITTSNLSKNFERDSPGPKRDIITQNIDRKNIEDSNSWNGDHMQSDENSDNSSDLLPANPLDIKKMAPYDQRKELGENTAANNSNKKLNIMYDELEDSGSEGRGPINRDDINHLASIIEEEEEATEYQRSRSRSNTRSPSPMPNNLKTFTPADNTKQKQDSIAEHPDEYKSNDNPEKLKEAKKTEVSQNVTQKAEKSLTPNKAQSQLSKKQDSKSLKSSRPGRQNRDKAPSSKSKKRNIDDKIESQSMKNTPIVHDKQVDLQDYVPAPIRELPEESVKLEAPSEDPRNEPEEDLKEDPKFKTTSKKKIETEKSTVWAGPKPLKLLWSILASLGTEKALDFPDFLTFYLIFSEITTNKRLPSIKSLSNLLQKFQKLQGKPSHNMPSFLWAFMNPDRLKSLKKRTFRDVIRVCSESKGKGRKWLLDGVEESVRQSEGDMEDTLRNLRLTFNYPGTKRALISFAESVNKVDARVSLSREVATFVASMVKDRQVMDGVRFVDPIQGIESAEQDEGENEEQVQEPNYSDFVPREPQKNDQIVEEAYYPPDPEIQKRSMKGAKSNADIQLSAHLPNLVNKSHQSNLKSANISHDQTPGKISAKNTRLQINYDEDFDDHARVSQHAFSEQPHAKLEGSKMNVLKLYDKKNLNPMMRTYNALHYQEDYRKPESKHINLSQKSDDLSKSLQYRKPINSPQTDVPSRSNRNRSIKNKNVFTLKKNEPRAAHFDMYDKPRDRTPLAKNTVNFEEPPEQHERSRSKDKTSTRPKSSRKRDQAPKKTPVGKGKSSMKSASSRKSSKKRRSTRKKTIDSESDYDKSKSKIHKNKEPKVRYDESSTSEEREQIPKASTTKSKLRSAKSKKSTRKPRYQDEEFDSEQVKERSKSHAKNKKKLDEQYESQEKSASQEKPKKKVLFQVDINMDSKIVRIAIHHGDNIDRIVEKFDTIFKLKPKQKNLLIQRLKDQYIEMMNKETGAYES